MLANPDAMLSGIYTTLIVMQSVTTCSTGKPNNHITKFPTILLLPLHPPYIKYWLCFFLQKHN